MLDCFSLLSGFRNFFAEKIALPEFFTPAGRSFSILPASRQRFAVFGLDFAAEEVQRAVLEVADFVALVGIPAVRAVVANLEAANLHRDGGKTQRHVAYGQETERLRFAISTKGECQHRRAACGVQAKVRDFHVAGPFRLSLVRFRKKLTVIGIIGHTQGVNKASSPPTNPAKKI